MPSLREEKQPDAVIDLRHRSSQRASTDEVVLVDGGLPELPPEPVFAHEPVELDAPGATRRKRRVAELEEIAAANAEAAREARAVAREQWEHLAGAVGGWRSAVAELSALRRELKGFAAARADLVARERERAEQTARTDVAAELQHVETERDEQQAEIDRLRVALADEQSVHTDNTHRLREEQRRRGAAEKEAKRAIAAFETAERRLEAAGEALHRSAADEQARIEAIEAERAAAVAELDALGGGGRLAELSNRVEDLVAQLADLDGEVVEMRARAETAEEQVALAATDLTATRQAAEEARADAASTRERLDETGRERDALRVKVASLEEVGEQWQDRASATQSRAETAEAERDAAVSARSDLATLLSERDVELSRAVASSRDANTAASELESALTTARSEVAEARTRADAAQSRLDEIARERDVLLQGLGDLEAAAKERERQFTDALARAEQQAESEVTAMAAESRSAAELEAALVSARTDADELRHETAALAAQLEEAWAQVEEARRLAAAHDVEPGETVGPPADGDETLLDALAELAADPVDDDESVDPDARFAPRPPDPEDPDARRAALGFLNSLASDLPASRRKPS